MLMGVHRHHYRRRFEEEADKLDNRLLYFKIATYAIGVTGGFLSFLSLEVGGPPDVDGAEIRTNRRHQNGGGEGGRGKGRVLWLVCHSSPYGGR